MAFYALEARIPKVHSQAYVHPDAVVIGDVTVDRGCYIGPGAVLRADWGCISIKEGSNIQENCVLHARPDDAVQLEADCHVGHGAIIHGAKLEAKVLVGMGAILFDGVQVGAQAIIGAGSVLPEGFVVPPRSIVAGVPAKIIREASDEELANKAWGTALYQKLPELYSRCLREVEPQEL
jgi:phenylacetic acid degradation protein